MGGKYKKDRKGSFISRCSSREECKRTESQPYAFVSYSADQLTDSGDDFHSSSTSAVNEMWSDEGSFWLYCRGVLLEVRDVKAVEVGFCQGFFHGNVTMQG